MGFCFLQTLLCKSLEIKTLIQTSYVTLTKKKEKKLHVTKFWIQLSEISVEMNLILFQSSE